MTAGRLIIIFTMKRVSKSYNKENQEFRTALFARNNHPEVRTRCTDMIKINSRELRKTNVLLSSKRLELPCIERAKKEISVRRAGTEENECLEEWSQPRLDFQSLLQAKRSRTIDSEFNRLEELHLKSKLLRKELGSLESIVLNMSLKKSTRELSIN